MFVKKTWQNRIAEFINRRELTFESGTSELVTVSRAEGDIAVEGDAFNAQTMNDLEDRIERGFGTHLYETLVQGSTTVSFSSDDITENSIISYFIKTVDGKKPEVTPSEIKVTTGLITMTFDAQETDLELLCIVQ